MAASTELNTAKRNLSNALGENMKIYLANLKGWFKQKMTKEEFDLESRRLLPPDEAHLHNEFLLAIVTKCQCLSSPLAAKDLNSSAQNSASGKLLKRKDPKMRKKEQSPRSSFPQRFVPVNPLHYAPPAISMEEETTLGFCSRELTLPDASMVHGRMYVSAWETELEEVADDSVRLVMYAVEHHLKTILTAVLVRRNAYKLREGRFMFGMGGGVPDPYLRQTTITPDPAMESEATSVSSSGHHIPSVRPSTEYGEAMAAKHISLSGDHRESRQPVSLFDLLEALQLHRGTIPSHTVYATNVERIIHKLWHPSQEELDQEIVHRQEQAYRQHTNSHHPPIRF